MGSAESSNNGAQGTVNVLERRAKAILQARPAYRETVEFYLTVFRRQIDWQDKVAVDPDPVNDDLRRKCFRRGQALAECYDPGIGEDSLLGLWADMKAVFRRGNDVLRGAMDKINAAQQSGDLVPGPWLREQRPGAEEPVAGAAERIGVDERLLATLARAVTFPHWRGVARSWLPEGDFRAEWGRPRCPTCGGPPSLAELRSEKHSAEGIKPAVKRFLHCAFCGSRWGVPGLPCPSCGSTKKGDAKYLFTTDEPELRIDFCNECQRYLKVIDGDKITGPVHVGLELLTAAHLDVLAREKDLLPMEVGT